MDKNAQTFALTCAFITVLWLGNNGARYCERLAQSTRVTFDGYYPVFDHGHAMVIPSLSYKECILPQKMSLADAKMSHRVHGEKREYSRWCLPLTGKEDQQRQLLDLVEHMRKERGAAPAIHAWDVGVPRNIMLFGDVVMLNPRLAAYKRRDKCLIYDEDTKIKTWVDAYLDVTVEYDTVYMGKETMVLVDTDACVVQQLL